MEFHLEVPLNQFFIRSVSEEGICVNNDFFHNPFIISGQRIVPVWGVESPADINEASLQAIFELRPEVVLLGTGKTQVFLPPTTQGYFFRRNIGFEVMTTDAACRTFNVLVAEGRHVVAALMPIIP
jgi:uncharacterized protein